LLAPLPSALACGVRVARHRLPVDDAIELHVHAGAEDVEDKALVEA
jgi:hypothetical protein